MSVSYYVYYRVSPDCYASAQAAVARIFSELRSEFGIAGRLARRREEPDTWMEIYEDVSDAESFSEGLELAARRHGIADCLSKNSGRTTEVFVPIGMTVPPTDKSVSE